MNMNVPDIVKNWTDKYEISQEEISFAGEPKPLMVEDLENLLENNSPPVEIKNWSVSPLIQEEELNLPTTEAEAQEVIKKKTICIALTLKRMGRSEEHTY